MARMDSPSTPAAPPLLRTRFHASRRDVTPADPVVQRMETPRAAPLGGHVQPALEFSHFVCGGVGPHGHALALTPSADATKAGPLPSTRLSRASPVLRAPRTPFRLRALSAPALCARSLPDVGCRRGSLL